MPKPEHTTTVLLASSLLVIGLLTASGVCAEQDIYSDADTSVPSWAADFYEKNTACTTASINRVVRAQDRISVVLDVEPATGRALATGNPVNRDNWMALHCPAMEHPAWKQNTPRFDVLIIATLGHMGQYELSCAQHHQQQAYGRQQNSEGVVARLKALLNNRD